MRKWKCCAGEKQIKMSLTSLTLVEEICMLLYHMCSSVAEVCKRNSTFCTIPLPTTKNETRIAFFERNEELKMMYFIKENIKSFSSNWIPCTLQHLGLICCTVLWNIQMFLKWMLFSLSRYGNVTDSWSASVFLQLSLFVCSLDCISSIWESVHEDIFN